MDRTIKITLGVLIIVLIGFVSVVSYDGLIVNTYRASLTGSYSYSLTITTDSALSNVTFFMPVPEDVKGTSPVVSRISGKEISGLPGDWQTTLFGTGKATLVKITTASITPPPGTTPKNPYVVTVWINTSSKTAIDTLTPAENGVIFRPVQDLRQVTCPAGSSTGSGSPVCSEYTTPVYADYSAQPDASVTLSSSLDGMNSWKIFEPQSNEYHAKISLLMFGENHGWTPAKGTLVTGIGSFDIPK